MKNDPKVRQCQLFLCRRDGKPRCCADCVEKCSDPCANDPLKCGRVGSLTVDKPKPKRTPAVDETRALELWEKGYTDIEIGEALGLNRNTIFNWRKRTGLGPSKKGERRDANSDL